MSLFNIPNTFTSAPVKGHAKPSFSRPPDLSRHSNQTKLPELSKFSVRVQQPFLNDTKAYTSDNYQYDTNALIQNTWTAFSSFTNAERNLLLKGLLARSSSSQVEYICTTLNLKATETYTNGKTLALHPDQFAYRTVRPSPTSQRSSNVASYPKPWLQEKKKARSPDEVDPNSINSKFKEIVPGDGDYDTMLEYFFPGRNTKRKIQEMNKLLVNEKTLTNPNMYTKLFNSQFDINKINNTMKVTKPELSKKFAEFLTAITKKMQDIMKSIHEISIQENDDQTLEVSRNCLRQAIDGKYVTVYVFEESTQDLIVKSSNWHSTHRRLSVASVVCAEDVLHHHVSNIFNVKSTDHYTTEIDLVYGALDVECVLSLPIKQGSSRVVGILEIVNKEAGLSPYFSSEDVFIAKTFAALCSLNSVGSMHVSVSAAQVKGDVNVLSATSSLLSSELDLQALVVEMIKKVRGLVSAERCSVFMVDEEKQQLWSSFSAKSEPIRIPITTGVAGWVATHGETCNIRDAYNDSRFNKSVDIKTGFRTRTILCMPMKNSKGKIIGVTQIINKKPENTIFNKEDEALLESFSSLSAATIEKSIVFGNLQGELKAAHNERFKMEVLSSNTPDLMITLNEEGKLMSVNHPEKLLIERPLSDLSHESFESWLGSQNSNELLMRDLWKAYKAMEVAYVPRYSFKMRNGASKLVSYTIYPIKSLGSASRRGTPQTAPPTGEQEVEQHANALLLVISDIDQKRKMIDSLSEYMGPELMRTVMGGSARPLNGVIQRATSIFFNIRSFDEFTEAAGPLKTVTMLNEHANLIDNVVTDERGILDKFAGDTAFAVFGLPYLEHDDPIRAVSAALNIRNGINKWIDHNIQTFSGINSFKVGLSVCTGLLLSGLIGPKEKMTYTTVGRPYSILKQLDLAAKLYGVDILIDGSTKDEVKDEFHIRELDIINLKGAKPTVIYEVIERKGTELSRDIMTSFICYELGLNEYRQQNWLMAISHFRKATQLADDPPSQVFINRCKAILDGQFEVPAQSWDTTWDLDII